MGIILRMAGTALAAVYIAVTPAIGHDHATGVVKERMEQMDTMAKLMKAIGERIKSKRDLAAIKADAIAISALAPHVTHLFPKGSTQAPTEAKLTIWNNWPDFENKARALEVESGKLANISADDFAALSTQVRAVSQACGACHEKYRAKK